MIALPDSGSFDAGINALDRISAWLASELDLGMRAGRRADATEPYEPRR